MNGLGEGWRGDSGDKHTVRTAARRLDDLGDSMG
jgi:hypothetical protein